MKRPFDFLSLPPGRSVTKPRATGLTMMIDMGQPPGYLHDYLRVNGDYIDVAKIFVGSARLYDEAIFLEKSEIYRQHGIDIFIGGQFLEYVFCRYGWTEVARFCSEARRLDITTIEVSDNCITLSDNDRRRLIRQAVDAGLNVHGEVGSKETNATTETLIAQSELALDAGCDVVLFEAAELVSNGVANKTMLDAIRCACPPEKIMIELPGPWIQDVDLNDVFNMMTSVINGFGPDANIGNVTPDQVLNLECLRCEIGIAGPTQL